MNLKIKVAAIFMLSQIAGCSMLTIGEEEFSCPGRPQGVICKGVSEVYDLTNSRNDLESYSEDEVEKKHDHVHVNEQQQMNTSSDAKDTKYIYKPQFTADYNQPNIANVATQINDNGKAISSTRYAPMQGQSQTAPEALAVLQEAEAMRIYVTSWEDDSGDLNMPGYIYVELKPKRWIAGRHANLRPSRIVPFKVSSKSRSNAKRTDAFAEGIDPLDIERVKKQKRK